jgi:methyl-accepting chemotaxis protein
VVGFIARFRLGYQMGLMVLVFLTGFILSSAVSMYGLRQVMVNGPLYQQIARDQELIADILPPPAYIVDAYANVLQLKLAIENGADEETVQRLLADSQRTRQDYEERLSYWRSVLPEGEIRQSLTEQAADPAREFFDIRDRQVIPALLAGETARAEELIWNELRPRFEAHRSAIDRTVELGYASVNNSEQSAKGVVARVNVLVPAVSLISALLATLLAALMARLLTKRLGHMAKALDELTTHDIPALERALGALARGDLRATVSFKVRPSELTGRDEVATLIGAYNRLQSALGNVEQSFRTLVEGLRDMVTSLRGAAALLNDVGADVHRRVEQTTVAIQSVTGAAESVARGSADQANALTGLRQSLTELAQTSDALAKAAADQARVVHQAFELASEINRQNQEAAQTARAVGRLATEHAQQGQRAVERTLSAITRAQAKSTEAQKRVDEMVKHAQSIDQVLTIVRSITEQTNLLALNAAIEAARAGEAGRGFAVVAEEVRKLSANAAESTTHIAELVHQLQNSAASAVQAATESLEAMTGVVAETNTVSDLFESTAEAARELATLSERALTLAEQALKSVEYLRAQLEQAASTVEETSAGTAELATSVATISTTASQLSAIGEENAQASEHASNAMEEISHELSEVAHNAQALFQLAQQLLRETERFLLDQPVAHAQADSSRRLLPVNSVHSPGDGLALAVASSRTGSLMPAPSRWTNGHGEP